MIFVSHRKQTYDIFIIIIMNCLLNAEGINHISSAGKQTNKFWIIVSLHSPRSAKSLWNRSYVMPFLILTQIGSKNILSKTLKLKPLLEEPRIFSESLTAAKRYIVNTSRPSSCSAGWNPRFKDHRCSQTRVLLLSAQEPLSPPESLQC
jgi:hypothetical protein